MVKGMSRFTHVSNCTHITIRVFKYSGKFNCISHNHSFKFIQILAVFGVGNVPAVKRPEVAA